MNYFQLIRRYPRYLAYGYVHYFFSFVGQTFFISLFVEYINKDFGWENTLFASLYSAATLISAFLLPRIGRFIDALKIRYISTAVALWVIFGCLCLYLANTWWMLFIGILATRMGGQGIMVLIGATSIGRYFTNNRGKALSLSIIGVSTAEIGVPVLAVWLISLLGWHFTWIIVLGLIIGVFLPLIWFLIPLSDDFQQVKPSDSKAMVTPQAQSAVMDVNRGEVLKDSRFWAILPVVLFMPFFITGILFNQNLLAQAKGWPLTWLGICFSAFGIMKIITLFSIGGAIDKFSARQIVPLTLIPVMIGTIALNLSNNPMVGFVFMAFCGLSGGAITVSAPALWPELYGQRHLGAIKSMVSMMIVLAAALAPVIFSLMKTGPQISFFLWGLIFAAAVFTLVANFKMLKTAIHSKLKQRIRFSN